MVHEFIVACKDNDLNKIQQMLHMVDIPMNEGFISACGYGQIDVIKYLVPLGVDIHTRDEEGFIWACSNGKIDVVKYLVLLGVDIHARDEKGFIWACEYGHIAVVRYLVENTNVNIHTRADYGFRYACCYGQIDVIRYFVNFMQCVKYRKLDKISQIIPNINYKRTNVTTYLINVGRYMNHLNNNFIL